MGHSRFKYLFNGDFEDGGQLEGEVQRRVVLSVLDGQNGLTRHAGFLGQFVLGDLLPRSKLTQMVLHVKSYLHGLFKAFNPMATQEKEKRVEKEEAAVPGGHAGFVVWCRRGVGKRGV